MRDSESVTGAALPGQPTLNALKEASDGFATMGCGIDIGEPSKHAFRVGGLNLFQRFTPPRIAVQILQFFGEGRLEPQSFGGLSRPLFGPGTDLMNSRSHPTDRPKFFEFVRLDRFIERKGGFAHSRGRRVTDKRYPSRYIRVFQGVTSREPTIGARVEP